MSVLLRKPTFPQISQKELAQQLSGKQKARNKLPTWFRTEGIYYPSSVQMEQTSSEKTAHYKSGLVGGKWAADLTGGFGVDTYFFSKQIPKTVHCEWDRELHEIARHNAAALGMEGVDFQCVDGIEFLSRTGQHFDWIYLDPGRRDTSKKKVFLLSDCVPDVTLHTDLLLERSDHIMIKTSPMLDLSAGIDQLKSVKEIHVVAVENDVKELLWILEEGAERKDIRVTTVNIGREEEEQFAFRRTDEGTAECTFSPPGQYLYEPNSALLKAGAFKILCKAFGVQKLQEHSHLYTSDQWRTFPGRAFRVEKVLPVNKKMLLPFKGEKANVSTRNFPRSVAQIRKQFGIMDGGERYLFFTTNNLGERIAIQCSKLSPKDIPS